MRNPAPTFPPLLTGHKLAADKNLSNWVRTRVGDGRLGAGDLIWSDDPDTLRFALVLEPDVPRKRCPEILYVAMVAIGDAIGALAPPEVSVMYQWPSILLANEADVGHLDLTLSGSETDGVPDWMVLWLSVRIRPGDRDDNPGENAQRTNLWEEGCSALNRTGLLEAASRHLVNVIHNWSEEGFKPIHEQWWGRRSEKDPLTGGLPQAESATILGLDEIGNALLKQGTETSVFNTLDALRILRSKKDTDR